ncbi:MAG: prephenate dehydrogenase/arogenate dehydrogenase family protein [Nitrospirota bacterium]
MTQPKRRRTRTVRPSSSGSRLFHRIAIIGVGLMGGSLGLATRAKRLAGDVIGADRDAAALRRAVKRGAIDRPMAPAAAVREADLVVLATPVGGFEAAVKACAGAFAPGAIVTDVGSVKGGLIGRLEALLPPHVAYLSSHPLAGREQSGVEAASSTLFEGCRCVLTPGARSRPEIVERLTRYWEGLGSTVTIMTPEDHDRDLAVVSHLPHLVAYALVTTALEAADRAPGLLQLTAGGFRDFTRIAASSPEMWRDICLENRPHIVAAMDHYRAIFDRFRALVASGDGAALERAFEQARRVKRQLR